METHVQTVLCPECGRQWTGEFVKPPTENVCRDCIAEGKASVKDSLDIHINPGGVKRG